MECARAVRGGPATALQVCWGAQTGEDAPFFVAAFVMKGAAIQEQTCTLGRRCEVQLGGSGLKE